MSLSSALTASIWSSLGGDVEGLRAVKFVGDGALSSAFAVTDFGSASIAVAALAVAELVAERSGRLPAVRVDRRLTSFWFALSLRPIGWSLPPIWDSIADVYRAKDGWIRLHTNAPHHKAAALRVLEAEENKESVAAAVAQWVGTDLEQAIVNAGGCAAEMRSIDAWSTHPQGRAVAGEPLIHIANTNSAPPLPAFGSGSAPLAGIRVLDLTRVLAGPVASRFLAGFGAQVLRIDPPDWNEPAVIPEVTLGKRCARLDLKNAEDRATFESLLAGAHVMLHGYRAGALDSLGYDAAARRRISPGLIDVSLNAYGWSGPWRERRGFDSLVQMSAGIADAGMRWKRADKPVPLPLQALDHATGYLLALAVLRGLKHRLRTGEGTEARLSLARTAKFLVDQGAARESPRLAPETPSDLASDVEVTSWGPARRLLAPVTIEGAPMHWKLPATDLGSAPARWSSS